VEERALGCWSVQFQELHAKKLLLRVALKFGRNALFLFRQKIKGSNLTGRKGNDIHKLGELLDGPFEILSYRKEISLIRCIDDLSTSYGTASISHPDMAPMTLDVPQTNFQHLIRVADLRYEYSHI
jgi:hypothetical protein